MTPITYEAFRKASPRWRIWMLIVVAGQYGGVLSDAEIDAAAEASADPLERSVILATRCSPQQRAVIMEVLSIDWDERDWEATWPPN